MLVDVVDSGEDGRYTAFELFCQAFSVETRDAVVLINNNFSVIII